jgi:hypothetical protein
LILLEGLRAENGGGEEASLAMGGGALGVGVLEILEERGEDPEGGDLGKDQLFVEGGHAA